MFLQSVSENFEKKTCLVAGSDSVCSTVCRIVGGSNSIILLFGNCTDTCQLQNYQ